MDASLRVALVCDYSLEYLGGAQAAFQDQAMLLHRAGASVFVIAPGAEKPGADMAGTELPGAEKPGTDMAGTDMPGTSGSVSTQATHHGSTQSTHHKSTGRKNPGQNGVGEDRLGQNRVEQTDIGRNRTAQNRTAQNYTAQNYTAQKNAKPERIVIPARFTLPGVDLPVIRNTAALRAELREMFLARKVNIVHIHSEFGLTSAAVDVARELGIPVVHTVHTFFWQAGLPCPVSTLAAPAVRGFAKRLRGFDSSPVRLAPSAVDSALRQLTLSTGVRADVVISPSAHQATELQNAGLNNVVVVPNAVADLDSSPQSIAEATQPLVGATLSPVVASQPLGEITGPLRVAWIGRLVPEKRILQFVAAVNSAVKTLGSNRLVVDIVGDGTLLKKARKLAAGNNSIRFHGRLDRQATRQMMRESHIVALTSLGFDNQPVVVVEAFNEARSVMYVDAKLREGLADAGILCAEPDAAGMAQTLVRLANNPAEVVAASLKAVDAARVFSPESHLESLRRVYAQARA